VSAIKKWSTVLVVILAISAMVLTVSCDGSKADGASSEASGKSEAKETAAAEEETAEAKETVAAEKETTAAAKTGNNIGDTGPAGGFIFYINPNSEADGWQYLEAAPSDIPGDANDYQIKWFSGDEDNRKTEGTATAIGSGMSNTEIIVNIQGEGSYAAKLCGDLTLNGFSDWFLPSKDELDLMYKNFQVNGIGSFGPDGSYTYWSSSGDGKISAWTQLFIDGKQKAYFGMNNGIRARAVRAFK
jgi:hypothetical protein